jgi:hypothetical protein
MVMKARSATKSKLHAFFIFLVDGYVYSFRLQGKKLTVITSNILAWGGWRAPLCLSHISHCYISNFNCCGHGYSSTAMLP